MVKELIDAGRSKRGWSRVGNYLKCPQLFAYTERLRLELGSADGLTRGSMGHVMLAHQFAIWGAQQGAVLVNTEAFTDSAAFLSPKEALAAWCDLNDKGHEFLDKLRRIFDAYIEEAPEPPGTVLAVEWPMAAVFGWKKGAWGLWVVHPEEEGRLDEERDTVRACDDETIKVEPLNMEGHPDDGKPVYITRRVDAVIEEEGRPVIWDHKFQAWVSGKVAAYAMDGGFALFRHMGKQVFGESFGGVRLNLIQTTGDFKVLRPKVPEAPGRDRHLVQLLWDAENQIAWQDVQQTSLWEWPKVMHESGPCEGKYGLCRGLDLCLYGEAGQQYVGAKRDARYL